MILAFGFCSLNPVYTFSILSNLFTLADAVTEVQTEEFLADPLGAVFEVDVTELLSNFSELGMDMTDDQREKAQEVIIPVVIASQIAGAVIRRNK